MLSPILRGIAAALLLAAFAVMAVPAPPPGGACQPGPAAFDPCDDLPGSLTDLRSEDGQAVVRLAQPGEVILAVAGCTVEPSAVAPMPPAFEPLPQPPRSPRPA
jgi:hypothetical protein